MGKSADAQFRDASDQSLLVSFGETIEPDIHGHELHGPDIHGNVVKLLRLLLVPAN